MAIRFIAKFCTCVTILAAALSAQTAGTGTLVGTIMDTTGSVIAAAKISVVNADTAFVSETVASNEGAYQVPYLAPGVYRMTV